MSFKKICIPFYLWDRDYIYKEETTKETITVRESTRFSELQKQSEGKDRIIYIFHVTGGK